MKHFALWMALVGLTFTGCAQNKVFGPLARKGSQQNIRAELDGMGTNQGENIELAAFRGQSGCDDACCGDNCCCDCPADCCGGGECCGQCCGEGCCSDGSCSGDSCKSGKGKKLGGRMRDRCRSMGCRMMGCNPHAVGYPEPQNFNPSPPTGQVAYPYYTVRGPRDFFQNNPPSIGPY